jgi:hypothetical protein
MVMKLEEVVPFGRSMDEYKKMFLLSDDDLSKKIVGVGDGPASFNAEMSELGKSVVSVDPIYIFSADEIEKQFYAVIDNIISQVKATPEDWVWSYHRSPDHLKENRIKVIKRFLTDFENGIAEGRYVPGELPELSLNGAKFDLALCSHLLFLYSDHLTYEFHRTSVLNMLALASEVRIFPLLTLMLRPSPYVSLLIDELEAIGFTVTVEKSSYELQKGGNEMLRIKKAV